MEKNLANKTQPEGTVKVLQAIGALSTGIGAIVLMVEGLGKVDAIARFFSFSGILALCAALGLMISYRKGDQRSARILLMMYLGLVPVFWSQLGAVIYNAFGGDSALVPSALRIENVGLITALVGGAIATLVIAPFSALVAKVFIPKNPLGYTALLLSLGMLLCFPERSGLLAGTILVTSAVLVFFCERALFTRNNHYSTLEAKWSRGVLLSLLAIMVGRGAFYGFTEPLFFAITGLFSSMLYLFVSPTNENERSSVRIATDLFFGFGIAVLLSGMYRVVGTWGAHALSYLIPSAFLFVSGKKLHSTQAKIAFATMAIGSVLYMNDPSAVSGSLALLLPACAIYFGLQTRSIALAAIGLITFGIGSRTILSAFMNVVYDYRWSALMLTGITLVFAAPFLEKAARGFKAKLDTPKTTSEPSLASLTQL